MLVIRDDMFDALAAAARDDFIARVREHLRRFFPEICDGFGEPRLTQFIDYGIRRAERWGFDREPEVVQFIDLMAVFGHKMDRNPQLPWVRHILLSGAPPSPALRMRRLQEAAQQALLPNGGPRP